jgi:hypothetical protein
MRLISKRYALIALLVVGSATLLFSCSKKPKSVVYDYETLMTESSEHRTIAMIEDGKCSYTFSAPLIEGYSMATNPYQEFRRGIKLTTFRQDTITVVADTTYIATQVDAVITANYAIYYEKQQLWEAKGDVVVVKQERERGDTLVKSTTEVYTQQLYWDATIGKIYSNVDTRVITAEGPQYGEGFDTDESLKEIHFRKYLGEVEFDFTPSERDTLNGGKGSGRASKSRRDESRTGGDDSKSGAKGDLKRPDNGHKPQSVTGPQSITGGNNFKIEDHRLVDRPARGGEQLTHTNLNDRGVVEPDKGAPQGVKPLQSASVSDVAPKGKGAANGGEQKLDLTLSGDL